MNRIREKRILSKLTAYGKATKLYKNAVAEKEENVIFENGAITITPKFLWNETVWKTDLIPLESVLWIFEYQKYGFSLWRRRYVMKRFLCIYTIAGERYRLADLSETDIRTVRTLLEEKYPNFFYGYTEEHDDMVHYILAENKKEKRG